MGPRKTLHKLSEHFFEQILRELWIEFMREEALNDSNSLDINIQDQHTRAFDTPFKQILATGILLGAPVTVDAWSLTAAAGHGIQVGERLDVYDSAAQAGWSGTAIGVTVNDIDLDKPASSALAVATSTITRSTIDMNVDGSTTRQIFVVDNPYATPEDVTRIMFIMITNALPELDKFGDIVGGLARGLVFRTVSVDGGRANYYNVKTTADLVKLMYDVQFYEPLRQGAYGLCGRLTYSGTEKHGVALRLDQGDSLEMIIQDDLTSLTMFEISAAGHETEGEV